MTQYTVRHRGYTSEIVVTEDDSAAHSALISLGFMCERQTYGPDDSVIASYFRHLFNAEWTAEIVAAPTVCDLFREWMAAGTHGARRNGRQAVLARLRELAGR